ncbi:hypothetical protein TrLO_g2844 [Triparma laevis f. longispina]|uniref:Uncharacterized protein n=1 Tax=Triparma laevis f. longispina TaxID=1714387 RepID=A0A9W7F8B6_9STRA|nr:hypothetical protein TrLO_g2844 [Triparma laevis f. longispina]
MASFQPKPLPYVKGLVDRGDKAYESMEPQLAVKFYQEACRNLLPQMSSSPDPEYVKNALSHSYTQIGECMVQLGDHSEGTRSDERRADNIDSSCYFKCYSILTQFYYSPHAALSAFTASLRIKETAEVHLLIGQLQSAGDALLSFRKGVELLEKERRKKLLCQGYSNIAELWMTDLCMEPEAESSCEAAVLKACENDENKWPDGSQALSSLRLSQRRGGDASEAILKAYAMIEKGCVASANTVGLGSKDVRENAAMEDGQALEIEEEELKRVEELPGFEFRTQTSKLMLECAGVEGLGKEEVLKLADGAIMVLGSILCENDEVVETFFLLGCAFATLGDSENAMTYLNRAKEMLEKVKKGMEEELRNLQGFDVDGLGAQVEGIEDQMDMIDDKIEEVEEGGGGGKGMDVVG